jgi:hypothetical protein
MTSPYWSMRDLRTASKLAGNKAAASCRTPKLRSDCQQGSIFHGMFSHLLPAVF